MFRLTHEYDGHQIILMAREDPEGLMVVGWVEKNGTMVQSLIVEPLSDKQIDYYGSPAKYVDRIIKDVNKGLRLVWPDGDLSQVSEKVAAVVNTLKALKFSGTPITIHRP